MLNEFLYPICLPIAVSLVAYNSFLTGLMTVFKRRDLVGIRYFIFSSLVFLWGVGLSFMLHNELPDRIGEKWGVFSQAVALFIPVTWLHFVAAYTNKIKETKVVLSVFYLIAIGTIPFSFGDLFIEDFRPMVGVNRYPAPGPLYVLFTACFFAVVLYSFWMLYQAWNEESAPAKSSNYKWLFAAQLYGFGMGGLSFLPVYGVPFSQYNLLLMPIWQILLAYAIIRYRLMDYEEEFARAAHRDKLAAIGTIASSIHHEIRNPLYVTYGVTETFLDKCRNGDVPDDGFKPESLKVHEKVAEHAKRAMDIMAQLSVFAKQKGGIEIQKEPVSIRECLERVLPLVNHEMTLDNIVLKNHLPENLPLITANARQIEEVLFNLIVNACQALKKTGGEIEISGRVRKQLVEITISDNGPGIFRDQLKNIFEPFYTTKDEGTGLGLYIVRQLVERNGGRIRAEAANGGARFVLEFSL